MKLKRKNKFTLIELLVITIIIGILMSITAYTVLVVKERSKRVVDINNLKQIGIAMCMYAQDNNGYLPYISGSINDSRCLFLLLPYVDNSLETFYSPKIYSEREIDPEFRNFKKDPQSILTEIRAGDGRNIVYPGYAYSAVDGNGNPLRGQDMDPSTDIISNINGTYDNVVHVLSLDGSVKRVFGHPANESAIYD